jgi:hypothetical protein
MGSTWQSLLEEFVRVRNTQYRDDPEEAAARMESIEYTLQTILEKLRDATKAANLSKTIG